ncbi:O-antigen ligase family protein [Bosea sp. TND4EK4]|uniref:O-antigen ligase family protein n=1 Tax=Bosea sp. TND4EK4 TaxID=1907408 RepID=UPI0009713B61|nr:O-antigen ligase family protein [Bosea sp. TND4EK4]
MSQPSFPAGAARAPASSSRMVAAGMVFMTLMPLAMWLANRSTPLLLGLAAFCFTAAAALVPEGLRRSSAHLRLLVSTPLGIVLSAFLIWSLASILWSHGPAASLHGWAELALPIAFTLAIAASGRFSPSPVWLRALAVAIILACLLCIVELASGLSQRAALGIGKLMGFVFNRPAITALVLGVPVIHGLWSLPTRRSSDRLLAMVVGLAVAALALRSESASARLGLAVCVLCWPAALLWPRMTRRAIGSAFVLTMLLAPVLGMLAQNYMPSALLKRLPPMTGQARIEIWESFGQAARARPLLGTGFDTSPTLDRNPVAAQVEPERRRLLAVGHPHDMPLQAWVETGAVGAILMTLAGLLLLTRLGRMPAREAAPRLALAAACFAISVVGHGAWQGWWIAVLGASILWFPAHRERQGEHHG